MEHKTVNQKGCEIHYWITNTKGKPLVVFTHGATMDHGMFNQQITYFEKDFCVIVWDVCAHGLSRPCGHFSIPNAAEDLLSVAEKEGYKKMHVVGQSMGGYIVQEAVFRHPEKIKSVSIIGSTPLTFHYSGSDKFLLRITPFLLSLYPYDTLKNQIAKSSAVTLETQKYIQNTLSKMNKKEISYIMTKVYECLHYEPNYHIPCPLLLMHGDQDNLGRIKSCAPVWSEYEKCDYIVVPHAGHNANQDNPVFYNDVQLRFLKRIESD